MFEWLFFFKTSYNRQKNKILKGVLARTANEAPKELVKPKC
jgi:hypothetical protein